MAGTITKLEIQKNNKERVNVFLDEKYTFAVTVPVALGLKRGQFLSSADIAQFKSQDERNRAYDKAIYFLGFRARSRVEIERYLKGKEFVPDVIADTVNRLEQEGYLDDGDFAQRWAGNRQQFKPRSRRALRYELRQKGVSDADIESALIDLDEADAAWRALEKKLRQWHHLEEEAFRKKAMGFLSRRGFNYEITRGAVDRGWKQISSDDETVL